jgi:hypothetical protein
LIEAAEVTAIVRTARLAGSTSTNGESQQKESDVRDDELKAMVDAFLAWPLPADVAADAIACKPGAPHRTGTNLLTSVQARAMFEHCLAVVRAHDRDGERWRTLLRLATQWPQTELVVNINIGHDWHTADTPKQIQDVVDAAMRAEG